MSVSGLHFQVDREERSGLQLAGLLTAAFLLLAMFPSAWAAEEPAAPVARIVTLNSPIGDEALGQARRTVLEMQEVATRENRQAFVIFEIKPGASPFHSCYALADFLTAEPLDKVTTVAWVPETVTGMNVLVALACRDIVLGPQASLGDMGNGKALPADQQAIVKSIIERRRNPRVSVPLVTALMDPAVSLLQLTVEGAGGAKETRLATADEARKLQADGTVILDRNTISEAGSPTLISAAQARARDLLIARTAATRQELVDGYQLSLDSLRELDDAKTTGKVAYIQLHDVIDEVFSAFAQRQINRAVSSGAKLIIFEVDSPGGLLSVCQDLSETMAHLSDHGIKTVAYIPRQAISGGAILSVACDEIYMLPNAKIGDAIPINLMGNMIVHAEAKILSIELELLRDLAQQKNRPAAVLEAMADKDLEVFEATNKTTGKKWFMSEEELHQNANEWVAGPRVPESRPGIAIMVDGERAHELLIAKGIVADLSELRQRLGISEDTPLKPIGRTWVDTLVFNLNHQWTTGLLFFMAIVCIYIELATMTGFFGILSALAFAIFFWSRVLGGTATGLEVAIFVVGVACLMLEFFVIPGFGVFGISGILMVLFSVIMASQTFSGFSIEYDLARAGKAFATLAVALIAVMIASVMLSQYLHRIPLLRDLVLTGPTGQVLDPNEPRLRPDLLSHDAGLLGATGQAITILRPAGKARINGQFLDVVSDGPFIEEGTAVTVVQVLKNRIVVRQS
ncbi:NfeD family protein [Planctomicrobium piriforme]|uniref:Membrane-bound serine protease (ClpP class) n=1 Tax=Planctomicrobium piriforme TaxID=1576369 RepID=A0A1I3JBF3_9PLAN|nr:NfeD family protein [Planctomicrobium piriforme]SFI57255.1 membrane-bound serine protease (ClpP class) [Planctomicrobium piriforme]